LHAERENATVPEQSITPTALSTPGQLATVEDDVSGALGGAERRAQERGFSGIRLSTQNRNPDPADALLLEKNSSGRPGLTVKGDAENLREDRDKDQEGRNSSNKKDGDDEPPDDEEKGPSRFPLWAKLGGGLILLLLIACAGTYYYLSTRDIESTDDAYTDGRAVTISSKVTGYVVELSVADNQRVSAGDVLARVDPPDYITARDQARGNVMVAQAQKRSAELNALIARKNFPARLLQAQAQLQQARGQLFQAQTEFKRQHALPPGATTQQSVDQSTAQQQVTMGQVAAAEAAVTEAEPVEQNIGNADQRVSQIEGQLEEARAQLAQAELNLGYATIVAPQDGWITKRNIETGNYLQVGASIFSIVTPDVWVTANFKEGQLSRIRAGQRVKIMIDAYPDLKLDGHVDSVQLGSGSRFTAFPPENATGNFVKIVQRVPVKVVIDHGLDPTLPLPLGVSVVPSVELK
jgi:membrane fusion protein (multidrug efflux system)